MCYLIDKHVALKEVDSMDSNNQYGNTNNGYNPYANNQYGNANNGYNSYSNNQYGNMNQGYEQFSGNQYENMNNYNQSSYNPYGNMNDMYGNVYEPNYNSSTNYASGFSNLAQVASKDVVKYSYLFMVVALIITAGAALTTTPAVAISLLTGGNYMVLLFAELAIVFISQWAISKNKPVIAGILFTVYSYLTGMIFSVLFLVYTASSMASIFFICAAMFAVTSIYGMITKKDLNSVGSFCMMGLFGIIIATAVNMLFLHSSGFDLLVSIVGVFIFIGLTAYDANKTKRIAETANASNVLSLSLYCAFELYLDFINLLLKLIRIFGKRK